MDTRHPESEEGSSSVSLYLQRRRQQARNERRRHLRSASRPTTSQDVDQTHQTPESAPRIDARTFNESIQLGRPAHAQWAFRTPEERADIQDAREGTRQFGSSDDDDDDEDLQELDANDDVEVSIETTADVDGDMDDAVGGQGEEELPFDASAVGLKEISNLASFTVSSYKPGCGVKELRDDDVNQYWQSDGPQPHRLNIHFIKRVEIRALRLFLDYELDESYTPTKIQITAGWGPNLTIPFTTMELSQPKGWIDIPIAGAGGGPDGNSLCCFFVRVIILENHQNGKDTHIRGIKVYALDEGADTADNNPIDDVVNDLDDYPNRVGRMSLNDNDDDALLRLDEARKQKGKGKKYAPGDGGLSIPDFMREPEIR